MRKFRQVSLDKWPLLEITIEKKDQSKTISKIVAISDCVRVKESDFEGMSLKIIPFEGDPAVICSHRYPALNRLQICTPAHYIFTTMENPTFLRGERVTFLSYKDFKVYGVQRTEASYVKMSRCPFFN